MQSDRLKEANVSIHVMATGAGAGLQQLLWQVPGSSAYLSGASFPYAPEEQEELLGFMPEHFCSQEAAVDLASAAYMKAYKFGGKKAVGVGLAASVASEKLHRGDHRVHVCVMTDDKITITHHIYEKHAGLAARLLDGRRCDKLGFSLLLEHLEIWEDTDLVYQDATELATQRFWTRPFFLPSGQRLDPKDFKFDADNCALMPGAFHPPHEGHFGLADQVKKLWGTDVVFEVCATHPIKPALTVQQMLQRAKMLRGHHTLFTQLPLYIDKARTYPNVPIIAGADAIMRILDPQWGDPATLLKEFAALNTEFFIGSRLVDGKLVSRDDIVKMVPTSFLDEFPWGISCMFRSIPGQWDVSSTQIRNQKL